LDLSLCANPEGPPAPSDHKKIWVRGLVYMAGFQVAIEAMAMGTDK